MLKIGDKLICKTKGRPETEFCVRGEAKKVEGDIVTISRALKFGTLPMSKDLTLPESELLKYYIPLKNHASDDCLENRFIYEVTIVRTGVVFVRASSAAAAMNLADHLTTDHINWSDDWEPTDAEECNDYDGSVFESPDFD